ncbi:GatB/YqeY domain-containing protein [Alicyclobacillus tolerans]|uniref:GatB/YqeY domain-containing protein n=2 Tax=Alicyclobacillus tolerans TaxID=90970 RepID=A0A1M6JX23_9BACL|nr:MULTISPECIES: GatB/YqeY domain-containing protein [Alicyclobacillus]MDP9727378.1 uncharacterized protein YqeY [Alicyclobacillus tengchongensis]QRF23116.1 GatB/YqeY domain-containing protein [Alicyclobacillus sp. TC]SHJ51198.1 hypothetical protein SAMN05443507_10177 [Alicyclobacillus montanus]
MDLSARLAEDMKQAMKDKDKVRLSVIRMIRSAVKNREIELGKTLEESEVQAVISRELKQRKDSLQAFESAGRSDLVAEAEAEIAILTEYLPKQLSEAEIREIATQVMNEVGATGKADTGKVMGPLMSRLRGQADGKLVQSVVAELLSGKEA